MVCPSYLHYSAAPSPSRFVRAPLPYAALYCPPVPPGFPVMPPLSRTTFDIVRAEKFIQNSNGELDMAPLLEVMYERHAEIAMQLNCPANRDIINLMLHVQRALDSLMIGNSSGSEEVVLKTYDKVGSFRTDTMLSGHKTAEIVLMLDSMPTIERVAALSDQLVSFIKSSSSGEQFGDLTSEATEYGFSLNWNEVKIRAMICTTPENLSMLDTGNHIRKRMCSVAFSAVRHTMWFENRHNNCLRVLIRLLKDIRNRFGPMKPLTSRMIDLLAAHCLSGDPESKRPPSRLALAFVRCVQLISSGIFLPGSSGIPDPLLQFHRSFNEMNLAEMDSVCQVGQSILRLLHLGAYREIFFETPRCRTALGDEEGCPLAQGDPGVALFESFHSVCWGPPAFRTTTAESCTDGLKRPSEGIEQNAGCTEETTVDDEDGNAKRKK